MCPEQRSGLGALVAQLQVPALDVVGSDNGAAFGPALVVDLGGYAVGGRRGSKHIHNQTLVIPTDGEVHLPGIFRTPMPVEHVLAVAPVPVPLHFAPQFVDAGGQCLLLLASLLHVVLVHTEQGLHQKGRFHQVAPVVLLPERFHAARVSLPPVGVDAVEAVAGLEEGDDALHALQALLAGDVSPVYAGQDSHDAEAAASAGDDVLVVLRIVTVQVDAFAGQAAVGFGSVPEIVEGQSFDGVHQLLVGQLGGCGGIVFLGLALGEGQEQAQGQQ